MKKQSVTEDGGLPIYGINDIVKTWKDWGWEGLDEFAGHLCKFSKDCFHESVERDKVSFVSQRFVEWLADYTYLDDQSGAEMPEGEYLLEFVANPSCDRHFRPFDVRLGDRISDDAGSASRYIADGTEVPEYASAARECMRKALEKILTAFTACGDRKELISKLLAPAHIITYCDGVGWVDPEDPLASLRLRQITKEEKGIAAWLLDVLNDKKSCREAYWNCVWIAGRGTAHTLLDITDRIEKTVPVTDEQVCTLNNLVAGISSRGCWQSEADGSSRFVFGAPPEINSRPCCSGTLRTLLVQPAFALLLKLSSTCSHARFIRACRAPSCGELFYAGDIRTVTCQRRYRGKTRKTECQLEWRRYKQWLGENGGGPEDNWDTPELKEHFLAQDKPYYRESVS